MKFYVCLYNHWNPYSSEVNSIPSLYWALAFNFIQVEKRNQWETHIMPHAELVGQLTHPEIYKEYIVWKEREKRQKAFEKKGGDYYKEDRDGLVGASTANAYYDPMRGLVDTDGTVIIPKEKYEKMIGIDGIAVSW